MATKAQIKASNRYNKENTLTICLRLNRANDADIIEALELCESKQGYIKDLIRDDLYKNKIREILNKHNQ